MKFDFIITGGGGAGLSLAVRMLKAGVLTTKTLAIIEQDDKNKNDRTWCFWEKGEGLFESIVHQQWEDIHFYSNSYSEFLKLHPYRYKMIRGIDFYNHCLSLLKASAQITFIQEAVVKIENVTNGVVVNTSGGSYNCNFCFNSIIFKQPAVQKGVVSLLQHFKGWMLETPEPFFTKRHATLMDFRVSQQHGSTFVYVLPVNEKQALVEYTLFTEKLLEQEEYDDAIRQYIKQYLKISSYSIADAEFGIIPMTDYQFPSSEGRIFHIGTAGGWTKASSGYTFQFLQRRTQQIADSLLKTGQPFAVKWVNQKRFDYYDSIFLQILAERKVPGVEVFSRFFQKNKVAAIFRFLDNESSLLQDIQLFKTMPILPFSKVAIGKLFS
jgi:lycopene beta-cyclase